MKKLFTWQTAVMTLVCLGINIGLSSLIQALHIPLFLDTIGTIAAAALGGLLPAMVVGFVTNMFNSIADPISQYYAVLSLIIAVITYYMSKRGHFRRLLGVVVATVVFALIGGGLGSCITWLLYGFSFGSGISAPYAISLNQMGMSQFWAQFTADMLIDIADKTVSVFLVFIFLRYMPRPLVNNMRFGYIYDRTSEAYALPIPRIKRKFNRSLKTKVVALIVATSAILSIVAIIIGLSIYQDKTIEHYEVLCEDITSLARDQVVADDVEWYLQNAQSLGEREGDYLAVKDRLAHILATFSDAKYLYVYSIQEDGVHVVFDIDSGDEAGEPLGASFPFDESFEAYVPALLRGEEIDPVITDDTYGWLLTVYAPVTDSAGRCVAYVGTDVDMLDLRYDSLVFIISVSSLLFGAALLSIAFSLWYAEQKIINPIGQLVEQAKEFDYDNESLRVNSEEWRNRKGVTTGDELEELYKAMRETEVEIANYITDIHEKTSIIERMQHNIIFAFANMVEQRDVNTGNHIKRTSTYTEIIVKRLQKDGVFPDKIDDKYVKKIVQSAPLHDIGKIGISDTVLNKPGRLSKEEFEVMKTHTTLGRDIISSALGDIKEGGYLHVAMNMAAYHHEKWNGSGYPMGLSGEDIPLCARIMAVADVFDALVSKRSYKEAFDTQQAFDIIINDSGKHFDPAVVNAFVKERDAVVAFVKNEQLEENAR